MLKKKVKHRLTGSTPKQNKTGADIGGESVDSTGSRLGLVPTVRLPQPGGPGSAGARESANDREGRGEDIGGGEVDQTHSRPRSVEVEVAEGSGPAERKDIDGENVERLDPFSSTTSIPRDGKSDSTCTRPCQLLSLTTPQATRVHLLFLFVYQQLCVMTRAVNRTLPRMKQNRTGSLLRLPRPNYSSVG